MLLSDLSWISRWRADSLSLYLSVLTLFGFGRIILLKDNINYSESWFLSALLPHSGELFWSDFQVVRSISQNSHGVHTGDSSRGKKTREALVLYILGPTQATFPWWIWSEFQVLSKKLFDLEIHLYLSTLINKVGRCSIKEKANYLT